MILPPEGNKTCNFIFYPKRLFLKISVFQPMRTFPQRSLRTGHQLQVGFALSDVFLLKTLFPVPLRPPQLWLVSKSAYLKNPSKSIFVIANFASFPAHMIHSGSIERISGIKTASIFGSLSVDVESDTKSNICSARIVE